MTEDQKKLLKDFVEYKKNSGKLPSTIKAYNYIIPKLYEAIGIKSEMITIEHIERYINIMKKRKLAGNTINRRITIIKTFFKFLIELNGRKLMREKRKKEIDKEKIEYLRNLIEEYSLILTVNQVKAIKKEKMPFTVDELTKILQTAKNEGGKYAIRNYLILRFSGIGCGARNSAVRKLRLKDLKCYACNDQCENCIPTVDVLRKGKWEESKEESKRIDVQLEPITCQEIKAYIKSLNPSDTQVPEMIIFKSQKGGYLSIPTMNDILYSTLEQAGIEKKGRSFHSLRHTFVTEGKKLGTPYDDMMREVDHEGQMGETKTYDHRRAEDLTVKFLCVIIV